MSSFFRMFLSQLQILCLSFSILVSAAPDYQFSFGRISGVDKVAETTLRPYYAFYGIPFAAPPIGSLRFRAPQPYTNPTNDATKTISTTSHRAACIQPGIPDAMVSEDCLHLNIFTPTSVNNGGPLKKVMLWIHGGGYSVGSAQEYMPSRLVTGYDVIVVVVQYRLGVFGFLNPGKGREANFGLRDQILGIEWVKNNIRQFGGDPDDMTIFGESAGGSSVSLLSLSPLTKGLFTKAISQSGVALSSFATSRNPQQQFMDVATRLGCLSWVQQISAFFRDSYIDDIVDCLRKKSVQAFVSPFNYNDHDDGVKGGGQGDKGQGQGQQQSAQSAEDEANVGKEYADIGADLMAPSVDGAVLPRLPESLMADKDYLQANGVLDRSYIVGFNNNEGFPFKPMEDGGLPDYSPFSKPNQAENFVAAISKTLLPDTVTDDVMDLLFYEYTYPRGEGGKTDISNVVNVYSDVNFVVSSVQFVRALSTISPSTPVYLYLFDHYPEPIYPQLPLRGTPHAFELLYEFDKDEISPYFEGAYYKLHTPAEQPLYNVIRNSFTNFAKTGVPSSQEYSSWPRFQPEDEYYLAMSTSPEVRQRVYAKRMDLWTRVIPMKLKQVSAGRRPRFY